MCGAVQVGVLDVDLCGPSIPRMLGVSKCEVHQCDAGWVPVCVDRLSLMSIAFLLDDPDDAVVWRGPKKNGLTPDLSPFYPVVCLISVLCD